MRQAFAVNFPCTVADAAAGVTVTTLSWSAPSPSLLLSQDHQITGTHDCDTGLDPGQDQLKTAGDNSKYFSQTSHLSKAFYQILGINSL